MIYLKQLYDKNIKYSFHLKVASTMPISLPSVISMRAFQIRLLNWILLANVGFSLVLLLLGLTPLIVPPPYWSQVLIGGILLMLALWAIVRTAPPALRRGLCRDDGGGAVAVHLCTHEISGQ